MGEPLISIVIPVYNVEKELDRCIVSVLKQTYTNLEIILVNDGSTDNSGIKCEDYKTKDSRIKVIHKNNGGLSEARNFGMDEANGELITFIDSDDYVTNDYVEYLYNMMSKNDADVSIVENKKVWGELEELDKNLDEEIIFNSLDAVEDLLYQKHIENSAWAKLYKRKLFEGIRYPCGMLYEDLGTTYKVLLRAEKIVWSNIQKYYYYQRENSIMYRKFTSKNMDRIILSEKMLEEISLEYPELIPAAISRVFISNVQVLRELPMEDEAFDTIKQDIISNIKKYRKNVLFNKKAKKINRIIAVLSYGSLNIFVKLGSLYKKVYK